MNNALTSFALGSWRAEKLNAKLNALQEYYDNLEPLDERDAKEKDKIQEQQEMEGVAEDSIPKSKRTRPHNKRKN